MMKLHKWRHAAAVLLSIGLIGGGAQAQMLSDAGLEALYKADRFAELDHIAQQRLKARTDDTQAVLAAALAAQRGAATAVQRQAAIARAEACVAQQPRAADCQYALGSTLGVHALHEGMLKMAGSAGRVRTALSEAVTLAPAWYAARSALVNFYLLAPGMLGGSRDKAQDVARAAATPDQARGLLALVSLTDDKPEAALQVLETIKPGGDSVFDAELRAWGHSAGFALLNASQPGKARSWFERAWRDKPQDAAAAYGLGRVHAESGAQADALVWYERALRLEGAEALPIDYRIGIAQQTLGRVAEARAALGRFVTAGKGAKKALDDARRRLEQLGAA